MAQENRELAPLSALDSVGFEISPIGGHATKRLCELCDFSNDETCVVASVASRQLA
jgi:hypothetical protein